MGITRFVSLRLRQETRYLNGMPRMTARLGYPLHLETCHTFPPLLAVMLRRPADGDRGNRV